MCASRSLRLRSKFAGRFPLESRSTVQSPRISFWREPWTLPKCRQGDSAGLNPRSCLEKKPLASNRGHLRVVIFVLLWGVIFGVLGQAQGSHLPKNEENGCCWSFGVIFVASRRKLLFGAETLKLTIFCMYSCMYSCTQACSLIRILAPFLEWMLLWAPWWTFSALVEQLKRITGMSVSWFESGEPTFVPWKSSSREWQSYVCSLFWLLPVHFWSW